MSKTMSKQVPDQKERERMALGALRTLLSSHPSHGSVAKCVQDIKAKCERLGTELSAMDVDGHPVAFAALQSRSALMIQAAGECGFDWAKHCDERGGFMVLMGKRIRIGMGVAWMDPNPRYKLGQVKSSNSQDIQACAEVLINYGAEVKKTFKAMRMFGMGMPKIEVNAMGWAAWIDEPALARLASGPADFADCGVHGLSSVELSVMAGSPLYLSAALSSGAPLPSPCFIDRMQRDVALSDIAACGNTMGRYECVEMLRSMWEREALMTELAGAGPLASPLNPRL
jgi:hypothetical protein